MVKTILKNVFTGASVATAVMLVFVAYSDHIDPEQQPFLGCAGMVFPFFLLANLLILVGWLIINWRRAWIPLAAYLLAIPAIRVYFPINFHHEPPAGSLKVISYNVDCYNEVKESPNSQVLIYNYLKQQNADIVCLQEDIVAVVDSLHSISLLYPYNDTVQLGTVSSAVINAVGIHSRYPILRKEKILIPSQGNGAALFFLQIGNDTVCVVNFHLETTHLSNVDRKRYNDMISGDMDHEEAQAETRMIIGKLSSAMGKRARQADMLHEYIERNSRYPLIVCGDMNDTPISYVRRTIAQGLTDCFVESGSGLGFSYRKKGFRFRIDNIFCSSHYKPYNCHIDDTVEASDHFPVICWLHRQP